MRVTSVRVFLTTRGDTVAYAEVVFDDCFCVGGFRLVQTPTEYLLYMPDVKQNDGTFRDVAKPTTEEMARMIKDAIVAEYEKVTGAR